MSRRGSAALQRRGARGNSGASRLPPPSVTISTTPSIGATLTATNTGGPITSITPYRDGVAGTPQALPYVYVAADVGPSFQITATGPGGTSALSNALQSLLAYAAMEFSRGSEASVDEATSITPYAADVLRVTGGLCLLECYMPAGFSNPRNPAGAGWNAGTGTPGVAIAGPDGTAGTGYRYSAPSAGFGPYQQYFATALPGTFTLWRKAPSGTPTQQINLTDGVTGLADISAASVSWERRTIKYPTTPTVAVIAIPIEGRALGTTPPTSDLAQDLYFDCVQFEPRQYATSTVIDALGRRAADVATWPAYEVPTQLRQGRSRWIVAPIYASADLADGDVRILGSFGGPDDVLRIRRSGANRKIEAVVGGVVQCATAALTWSAGATISLLVDAAAAILTVESGVSGGSGAGPTGSAVVWPDEPFRLGGGYGVGASTTAIDSTEFDGGMAFPGAA